MKNQFHSARTSIVVSLMLAFACVPSVSQAAGLSTITAYAGQWKSHLVYYATAFSKAHVDDTSLKNVCWRSAGYYACDQFVNGPSKALIVFTYDAPHDIYHTYGIPTDGTPASSGKLVISGNTWTYPWHYRDHGKTVYGRVVNVFRDPNTIEFRQEFSLDQKHWTLTGRGIEHRISP